MSTLQSAFLLLTSIEDLICRMSSDLNLFGFFTRPTLAAFESVITFDVAPLYALMHEPLYARGYAMLFGLGVIC